MRPTKSKQGPDRRHLEQIHKRVTGDDGLGQDTIEPYHAPLLSMQSDSNPRQRAVQLRVVTNDSSLTAASRTKTTPTRADANAFQTVLSGRKSKAPSVKPAWGMTASGRPLAPSTRPVNPWGPDATEIPDSRSTAPAVQPVDSAAFPSLKGPDRFLEDNKPAMDPVIPHPVVSQKKAKKYEREARRKAKKVVVEEVTAAVPQDEDSLMPELALTDDNEPEIDPLGEHESFSTIPADEILTAATAEAVTTEDETLLAEVHSAVVAVSQPSSLPVTSHDKHTNWANFKRKLVVDQLTAPILPSSSDHMHPTLCVCETHDVLDCPFHPPCKCVCRHCSCIELIVSIDCSSCQDPLLDLVYLVYPCEKVLQTGPYNRLHGQKLLNKYRQHEHLKNRLMLVDDELLEHFMIDPQDRLNKPGGKSKVLQRLAAEYAAHLKGSPPGPLMEQERLFDSMWNKNSIMKHEISQDMLMGLRESVVVASAPLMCYCQDVAPRDQSSKNVVECAHRNCRFKLFHKACVKDLGVDKVSRWYCTECNAKMQLLAYRTLRDLGFEDVPDDDTVPDNSTPVDELEEEYSQMSEVMAEVSTELARLPHGAEITKPVQRKLSGTGIMKK